jgi:aminoglycoside phosphotransferase (APT) family kinase protein
VGPAGAFLAGYRQVSGAAVERAHIHFWEVAAHVRWGIIAVQQAGRHVSGRQPSLELALTGRMPSELARGMLQLMQAEPA